MKTERCNFVNKKYILLECELVLKNIPTLYTIGVIQYCNQVILADLESNILGTTGRIFKI